MIDLKKIAIAATLVSVMGTGACFAMQDDSVTEESKALTQAILKQGAGKRRVSQKSLRGGMLNSFVKLQLLKNP